MPLIEFAGEEPREYLFQQDIGRFLREHGFPMGDTHINNIIFRGDGPPVARRDRGRPLRTPEDVLEWARKSWRKRSINSPPTPAAGIHRP